MGSLDVRLGKTWQGDRGCLSPCGSGWWLLCLLMFLSLTAKSPDRNMTRLWHAPIFCFLYYFARECCNFDLKIRKHT